jgi:hypothetical protein
MGPKLDKRLGIPVTSGRRSPICKRHTQPNYYGGCGTVQLAYDHLHENRNEDVDAMARGSQYGEFRGAQEMAQTHER